MLLGGGLDDIINQNYKGTSLQVAEQHKIYYYYCWENSSRSRSGVMRHFPRLRFMFLDSVKAVDRVEGLRAPNGPGRTRSVGHWDDSFRRMTGRQARKKKGHVAANDFAILLRP